MLCDGFKKLSSPLKLVIELKQMKIKFNICKCIKKNISFFKGSFMSLKRIFSCHPIKFLGGNEGFDPVIKDIKVKK